MCADWLVDGIGVEHVGVSSVSRIDWSVYHSASDESNYPGKAVKKFVCLSLCTVRRSHSVICVQVRRGVGLFGGSGDYYTIANQLNGESWCMWSYVGIES